VFSGGVHPTQDAWNLHGAHFANWVLEMVPFTSPFSIRFLLFMIKQRKLRIRTSSSFRKEICLSLNLNNDHKSLCKVLGPKSLYLFS
jgi:hypothetical protein